ncbi:MAG: ankyrin repeat domain-containing protein [Alphaproteobacteria bacterium]|nr:ankyrin repeat domain-containing protein [Alphaproteobacteria bacterium]
MNGDQVPETLYLESDEVGWRYLGVNLYLVNDIDLLEKNIGKKLRGTVTKPLQYHNKDTEQFFTEIYSYRPPRMVHFIKDKGGLFTISIPEQPRLDASMTSELVKLKTDGSEKICEAKLLPEKEKYKEFTDKGVLFEALTNVYGEGDSCMGTLGWTAKPLDSSLSNIFERPQILEKPHSIPARQEPWTETKTATQLRFISWALSDPMGWETYKTIMASKSDFILYLKNYYKQYFKYSNAEAKEKAELAWNYWLNNIIYARGNDLFQITLAAKFIPDTNYPNTKNLINTSYNELIKNKDVMNQYTQESVYPELLLALIYTRSEPLRITELYQIIKGQEHQEKEYQEFLDRSLLAAIGDDTLTKLSLDQGANINAETNWYKKTPLMYAAQANNLNGVKYLIKAGANLNIKTDGSEYRCTTLERDNRTALMYAAESAEKDIILSLINSGADISSQDSTGNTTLWYFERNKIITDPQDRELLKNKLKEEWDHNLGERK